ncbi:retrovirus-related pol polyprotein from transposon TNT 1-94 [Tanacetum coccineum]
MLGILILIIYLANSSMKKTSLIDFQDSPADEEDTRSSQEYMNDLKMEFLERALLVVQRQLTKLNATNVEVSSDDNEMVEVKVLMAPADDESGILGKESAKNGEWVKISMRKSDIRKPIWSTIFKKHIKIPYEIFHGRLQNISFLHVFRCPIYIHNQKDHLEKFDEKSDDGYFLGHSLVSKAFRVFNAKRQQIKETYHNTFDERTKAVKFLKPSVDDLTIVETKRYPPNEFLHHFEPSQRYEVNERPEHVVTEVAASCDQNDQLDQNDQPTQNDEILNDDHAKHSNHTIDENTIDNLTIIEDVQITEQPSSKTKDASVSNTVSQILPEIARMLTMAMAKELSVSLAYKCLFVDFLSKEEPKKVSEALKHPGWVNAMQLELNQFARNKFWTLVPLPYRKSIIRYIQSALVKTLMVPPNNLGPDLNGKAVNETQYRGMTGSLMYLTISRPEKQFSTCLCARYQANPKDSHLIAVNRIFRKSTPDAYQFLRGKLVCWSAKKQQYVAMSSAEAKYVPVSRCCANIL